MGRRQYHTQPGHKKKKKKPQKAKKQAMSPQKSAPAAASQSNNNNWVERVRFSSSQPEGDECCCILSIVSWNILAASYCSRYSQCGLPQLYQKVVFSPQTRQELMLHILKTQFAIGTNVICLQELDLRIVSQTLATLGYDCADTTTCTSNVVACAIFVQRSEWKVLDSQVIALDDLATLSSSSNQTSQTTSTTSTTIQGIQQSFLRHNTALLVRIQHVATQQTVCVANAHLYWNPGFEYVKLCQAHYILVRLQQFAQPDEPVVLAGDLNSRPQSVTYHYLSRGWIDAQQTCAPWYHPTTTTAEGEIRQNEPKEDDDSSDDGDDGDDDDDSSSDEEEDESDNEGKEKEDGEQEVEGDDNNAQNDTTRTIETHLKDLKIHDDDDNNSPATSTNTRQRRPHMRYLVDASLNKFCRWLRILGQDTLLESEAEESIRTKSNNVRVLFDRCRNEQRTLVTTSPRLVERRDCPTSTYCLTRPNVQSTHGLEQALVQMLRTHGVELEPSTFLTRCVVCNGHIAEVTDQEQQRKRDILQTYEAPPDLIHTGLRVYECNGCQQGYWWNDRPTSSASRVKATATQLLRRCMEGGVAVDTSRMGMFAHVVRADATMTMTTTTTTKQQTSVSSRQEEQDTNPPTENETAEKPDQTSPPLLQAVEWLNRERLTCPFDLQSVYDGNNSLPFTNVTHDFVDTLDYLFVSKAKTHGSAGWRVRERLHVPTTFAELAGNANYSRNQKRNNNAHLLPSNVWPSDHLAVGAVLELVGVDAATKNDATTGKATPKEEVNKRKEEQEVNDNDAKTEDEKQIVNVMEKNGANFVVEIINGASAPPPSVLPHNPIAGPRCACGCVPMIPSLFEMAALRKQQAAMRKNNEKEEHTPS